MPDNRHLVFFGDGVIQALDSTTGQVRSIDVPLPAAERARWQPISSVSPTFAIARDGRTIYYGARRQEADIWLAEKLNRN